MYITKYIQNCSNTLGITSKKHISASKNSLHLLREDFLNI